MIMKLGLVHLTIYLITSAVHRNYIGILVLCRTMQFMQYIPTKVALKFACAAKL